MRHVSRLLPVVRERHSRVQFPPQNTNWFPKVNFKCNVFWRLSYIISLALYNRPTEAELLVGGPFRREIKYDTIALTNDIRELDGEIIDCRYVDHHWIFLKVRKDRKHPNGKRAVLSKRKLLFFRPTILTINIFLLTLWQTNCRYWSIRWHATFF